MSGINIIISIYSLIIKMALENKALEIHNIILKKLVEDPNRREIGSFFVLDVKNYNGKIEYWLQGNFCKEDLQLEEFQLDLSDTRGFSFSIAVPLIYYEVRNFIIITFVPAVRVLKIGRVSIRRAFG